MKGLRTTKSPICLEEFNQTSNNNQTSLKNQFFQQTNIEFKQKRKLKDFQGNIVLILKKEKLIEEDHSLSHQILQNMILKETIFRVRK